MSGEMTIPQPVLPKFDRSVSLLCWGYNEEESIGEYLVRAIELMDACVEDYEIILIDDGSTDRMYEIAKSFQLKHPQLKIFQNECNLNVGISSRRAIQLASKEYLFWQTIDWCYDISDLRQHLEELKHYDIVQGVRRKPVKVNLRFLKPIMAILKLLGIKHITRRSDTIQKAFVSVINYILIRVLFQVPLSDYQNVTYYQTQWVQNMQYESRSSFANPEGLIKSHWAGKNIKEVPINFIPRKAGEANGTKFSAILVSISDIFRLWFKWVLMSGIDRSKAGVIVRCK